MTATIMKKTKNLKTWLGLLKNMGGNFPGRNSPEGGGEFSGWEFSWGDYNGWEFSRWELNE